MAHSSKLPSLKEHRIEPVSIFLWCDYKFPGISNLVEHLQEFHDLLEANSLSSLEKRIERQPEAEVIILHRAPEDWICDALFDGLVPSEALEKWREETEQILQIRQNNRNRIGLLDTATAVAHPEQLLKRIGVSGHDIDVALKDKALIEPKGEEAQTPPPLLRLLAAHCLSQDDLANLLAGELEAAAFWSAPTSQLAAETLDDLHIQLQSEATHSDKTAEDPKKSSAQEIDLIQQAQVARFDAQLTQLQTLNAQKAKRIEDLQGEVLVQSAQLEVKSKELEQQTNNFSQQQTYVADLERLVDDHEGQIALLTESKEALAQDLKEQEQSASDAAEAAKTEHERLTRTEALLRRQLKGQLEELRLLHSTQDQNREHIRHLEGEVAQIMGSHSMKITAPLRALRRLLGRG
ncbi:MAG: hypothetical protein VX181_14525 [Pseudomonadota bacterium]|nr:hypothetical protein [Pseudomonadota bacterium]